MKLLHLANDFSLPETQVITITSTAIVQIPASHLHEEPRRTPVIALLVLLVLAGFSLTIPLHPTRSAVPNGCSTATALQDGESAATCILQATNPTKPSIRDASLDETPASYLVSSQVVSIQLVKVTFARVAKNYLLAGRNQGANHI